MALTTVLIPFGPGSRPYSVDCLRSLLRDLPDAEAEVLAVFDGGEPSASEVPLLRELGARLMLLPKQNQLGDVLNAGLVEVRTHYVTRMDSDDIWERGRLKLQLEHLVANPRCVLVGGQAKTIDGNGALVGRLTSGMGPRLRSKLLFRNQFIHPSVTFHVGEARRAGGYPAIERVEDYGLWLALAQRGEVDNIPNTVISYRVHSSQLSTARPSQAARALVKSRQEQLARTLRWPVPLAVLPTMAWRLAQRAGDVGLPRVWSRFKQDDGPVRGEEKLDA